MTAEIEHLVKEAMTEGRDVRKDGITLELLGALLERDLSEHQVRTRAKVISLF
ncbi:MAG: hypothetical protein P4M08_10010 [Oligoflexia bacterium]|nr:hypothetical protein [Oligoflexia bacterium]